MARQRVYMIGAGVIAGFHAEALDKLPGGGRDAELIVTTRDPARLKAFLKKYPRARGVADAAAMLAEPARADDIVIVTTPPLHHLPGSLAALASGRHVLCEKPLAMNRREAVKMVAAAKRKRRLIADCGGRFLNLAINRAVDQLIAGGGLGDSYLANFIHRTQRGRGGVEYQPESPWFVQKKFAGGGILLDWGPYDLTHLIELYRPRRVEILQAWARTPVAAAKLPKGVRIDVDMHFGATLRLHRADGKPVTVNWERASCVHGPERRLMELDGTHGSVAWDWTNWNDRTLRLLRDRGGKAVETKKVFAVDPIGPHAKPLVYLHAAVHGARLKNGVVAAGPAAGLAVNEGALRRFELLCAVYDCIADGRARTIRL